MNRNGDPTGSGLTEVISPDAYLQSSSSILSPSGHNRGL